MGRMGRIPMRGQVTNNRTYNYHEASTKAPKVSNLRPIGVNFHEATTHAKAPSGGM